MNNKRPIDLQRESAGSVDIGTLDDSSAITGMASVGEMLYVIKEKGIYTVRNADAIDPARTNPAIPNTQQRVLAYGSESKVVGQTFLTARQLFEKTNLSPHINSVRAIELALDALRDLIAMREALDSFRAAELKEIEDFNARTIVKGSVIVPAIGDVAARCKAYCHNAHHFTSKLFDILKLFYGNEVGEGGFEGFADLTARKYGKEDTFSKFAAEIAPQLKFIRNARDCFEHPVPPIQQAIVRDFELKPDGTIALPSVEVIRRKDRYPVTDISSFMAETMTNLPQTFEVMLAYLCGKHLVSPSGLRLGVSELPDHHRVSGRKHVRFSVGAMIGGQFVPLN